MNLYKYSSNYDISLLAELYDQSETYIDDVDLIRKLIGNRGPLNILECFSGTGRILVPLARDGHRITGIDIASSMSNRAAEKIAALGKNVQDRVSLKVQDVLDGQWGSGYDLVILGCSAFYELPSAEMQARCIEFAREALVLGGLLFIDNPDYKGDWDKLPFGRDRVIFEGNGTNGTYGKYILKELSFDKKIGRLYIERIWLTRTADGIEDHNKYMCSKHPVNVKEIKEWLKKYHFKILQILGDWQGHLYTNKSPRAIFWAAKK